MEKEKKLLEWTSVKDSPIPSNFNTDIVILIDNKYVNYCFWNKERKCLDYQFDDGDPYDKHYDVPIERITHYILLPEIPNEKKQTCK